MQIDKMDIIAFNQWRNMAAKRVYRSDPVISIQADKKRRETRFINSGIRYWTQRAFFFSASISLPTAPFLDRALSIG